MERAEYLLLKLLEQFRRNESKEQLLHSLKLIHEEIELSMPEEKPLPEPVSVVPAFTPPVTEESIEVEEKVFEVLQINEEDIEWENEETSPLKVEEEEESEEEEDAEEPKKEINLAQTLFSRILTPPPVDSLLNPEFEEKQPTPVTPPNRVELTPEPPVNEIHEQVKGASVELANKFSESPVRDLKKAIGINDRYRFINELFKGDETMFERSIKTINDFSIFPEAEFWVRRELKTKLGWNADDELVQLFDQLVRRRFS